MREQTAPQNRLEAMHWSTELPVLSPPSPTSGCAAAKCPERNNRPRRSGRFGGGDPQVESARSRKLATRRKGNLKGVEGGFGVGSVVSGSVVFTRKTQHHHL